MSDHSAIQTKRDLIKHLTEQQEDHSGMMVLRHQHHYTLGNLIDMHNQLHVEYVRMGQLARQIIGL